MLRVEKRELVKMRTLFSTEPKQTDLPSLFQEGLFQEVRYLLELNYLSLIDGISYIIVRVARGLKLTLDGETYVRGILN